MAYNIYKTDGSPLTVVNDGFVDTTACSLALLGKNITNFGVHQNENFVKLLENFAAIVEPTSPTTGQLWYNASAGVLRPVVYDNGNWRPLAVMMYSNTTTDLVLNASGANIVANQPGDMWFDTDNNQLYVIGTSTNTLVGPDTISGYGTTRVGPMVVQDSIGGSHPVIEMTLNGEITGIISNTEFASTATLSSAGFPTVYRGITLKSFNTTDRYITNANDFSLYGKSFFLDNTYPQRGLAEYIQGAWTFASGITSTKVHAGSSRLELTGTPDVLITANASGNVIISARAVTPLSANSVDLGTQSLPWNTLFTSAITANAPRPILTGNWVIPLGSSISPSSYANADLGSSIAPWGTVWTNSISAATPGTLVNSWSLTGATFSPTNTLQSSLGTTSSQWSALYTPIISAGSTSSTATIVGNIIIDGVLSPKQPSVQLLGTPTARWGTVNAVTATVDTVLSTVINCSTATINTVNATVISGILNVSTLIDSSGTSVTTFDQDITMARNSALSLPTQRAVKTYVDAGIATCIPKLGAVGILVRAANGLTTCQITSPTGSIVISNPAGLLADVSMEVSANIARLNSPAFIGTPTAPTASTGTSNLQLATTAFVQRGLTALSDMGAVETAARIAADASELQARITSVQNEHNAWVAAITTETNLRVLADSAEITARGVAISNEHNAWVAAITTETNTRIQADTTEMNARIAADSAETSARITALTNERAAWVAAINTETNARVLADSTEITARGAAILAEHDAWVAALSSEAAIRATNDTNETAARLAGFNTISAREQFQTLGYAASIGWDVAVGNSARVTLTGNGSMQVPAHLTAGAYILIIKQDAVGGRLMSWSPQYKFPSGITPVLSTAPNAEDIVSLFSDGISLYGSYVRGMM